MQRSRGFTLIEIAVVVTVIALLASIVIVSFNQVQKRSRDDMRTVQVTALKTALDRYYNDNGEYPVCPGGPNSECSASQYLTPILVPTYTSSVPDQPNNQPYAYVRGTPGDSYGIFVNYEVLSACKTGRNMSATWYGGWGNVCSL